MTPIVISASRRTDIPAFYMDWFMEGINAGEFHVKNPFNRRVSIVPAFPDAVHTIVFWSKDFGRFLEKNYGPTLEAMGYNLFFLFTVNSVSRLLEPNMPPLENRIEQAKELAGRFGPESVWWRFDPVCFFTCKDDVVCNNLNDFSWIAGQMAKLGIGRCIVSFVDIYDKIVRRSKHIPGFSFVEPPVETRVKTLGEMACLLESLSISLYTCCEDQLAEFLPKSCNIETGACISSRFLAGRFGGKLSHKKDAGQRVQKGCGCMPSRDIGCYEAHPCFHNCLYCYASPASKKKDTHDRKAQNRKHTN